MIVCKSEKELANATNAGDAAGAVAVKEMLENAGENVTLKPTTKVNVSGTLKNLNTYINQIAENTTNVLFGEETVLTATPDTYISSGTITYIKVGKVVYFTGEYTMLVSISDSCLLPVSSMPVPVGSLNLQFADHLNAYTYDSGVRSFGINNLGQPFLKGPHTAGTSYSCSGSYICN